MNFEELLAKANLNAKKLNKKVREADEEIKNDQEQSLKRMALLRKLEKEETKRKAPLKPLTPEPPKFVIPKKKNENKPQLDKNNVEKFLKKQEFEKQQKLKDQLVKKNELIKLRLEANNGKANKKISKQFGKSPLELQKNYGQNVNYELILKKQKQKEEEEHKKLTELYRKGVYNAIKKKEQLIEKCKLNTELNTKLENLNLLKNVKKSNSINIALQSKKLDFKQKNTNETTDFSSLMQKAKQNCNLDFNQIDFDLQKPPEKKKKLISNGTLTNQCKSISEKNHLNNIKKKLFEEDQHLQKLQNNKSNLNLSVSKLSKPIKNKIQTNNLKSVSNVKTMEKKKSVYVDPERGLLTEKRYLPNDIRYKNSQSSSLFQSTSMIQKEKRYLPGDIRYNPNANKSPKATNSNQETERSFSTLKNNSMSSSKNTLNTSKFLKNTLKKDKNINDIQSALIEIERRKRELKLLEQEIDRKKFLEKQRRNEENLKKFKKQQKQKIESNYKYKQENNYQNKTKSHMNYVNYSETDDNEDEENIDDEEYDSDLADFIDDTAVDDLQREDLEESLRVINPRYDKKKWKIRESMIDDRKMDSKFHEVELEERKSAKIGFYEDYIEARRGSKAIS